MLVSRKLQHHLRHKTRENISKTLAWYENCIYSVLGCCWLQRVGNKCRLPVWSLLVICTKCYVQVTFTILSCNSQRTHGLLLMDTDSFRTTFWPWRCAFLFPINLFLSLGVYVFHKDELIIKMFLQIRSS